MNSLYLLLRPWAYLLIKAQGKIYFDLILPCVLSLFTAIAIFASQSQVNFFGGGGIVSMLTGFIQNLPGFFIAALAAVATFDREGLDLLMPEPTPSVYVLQRGRWYWLALTRRRFLCLLFAFLTAQSITITLVSIAAVGIGGWLSTTTLFHEHHQLLSSTGVFLYSLLVWQMIVVTVLGLYYLGERMHEVDDR